MFLSGVFPGHILFARFGGGILDRWGFRKQGFRMEVVAKICFRKNRFLNDSRVDSVSVCRSPWECLFLIFASVSSFTI